MVVSLFCWALERIFPWRKHQKTFRKQIGQDFFWLVFNGHYAGLLLAYITGWLVLQLNQLLGILHISTLETVKLLSDSPVWVQFIVFLLLKDFIEWVTHILLHRFQWLWEFHKLHHTIEELDWIGNFRFHWMEIVIYKSISYLPLVILGVSGNIILWIAVLSTLIGHLNHSNLNISWGIFRYLINSPRMHCWHHDIIVHGSYGQNFSVVFSMWDWLLGTAFMPEDGHPEKLGFEKMEEFPEGLARRLIYPLHLK